MTTVDAILKAVKMGRSVTFAPRPENTIAIHVSGVVQERRVTHEMLEWARCADETLGECVNRVLRRCDDRPSPRHLAISGGVL